MPDAIVIIGATACGKTDFSIELAEKLGGEIISSDSRLVYRGLDIGTAKPSGEEMSRVPHHLVDILEPGERFTVSDFMELSSGLVRDIAARGKVPIFVGGTAMYLNALLKGWNFADCDIDESVRAELERRVECEGTHALYAELERLDPEAAARMHPHNARRIIRALEVFYLTGSTFSRRITRDGSTAISGFRTVVIGVCRHRKILHQRINKRAEVIYNKGLIGETRRALDKKPDCESFLTQVIGYADALRVIRGTLDEAAAIEATAKATRDYARRQIIWFRKMRSVYWLNPDAVSATRGIELVASALTKNITINGGTKNGRHNEHSG